MEACLKISDCLRISPSKFTYAGVKDKRSKSTQWFSVHKVEPWKLVMKTKSIQKVKVGNFTFKTEPLKLGQLSGNKFRIALRNVLGEDSLINQAMKQLKDNGFINYYGLQRFGNDKEVPTYEIGINLLLGKWKEAVQLILKPKTSDDPDSEVAKAKKIYFETEDVDKACEALDNGNSKCVEVRLLRGLKKENRNDFVNALENIPRNMRLLYIHSLQSFVWNSMVSKRLQVFGGKPVEGDFVLVDTKVEQTDEIRLDVEEDKEDEDCFMNKQEIKALTSEELPNYTIYDIVLPLPGYDVNYPEPMKQYYVEALEEHGLTLEMTKQKVKTYTLSGNYRKMLAKVNDLSWKIMRYDDPNENLIRSDFEELKGHPEPKGVKDGQYKALVMEFCLPPSSYATMVLREILKSDTSSSAQARQNDYHETQPSKKIIIESEQEQNEDKSEECCDGVQTNSLLSDAKKYEAFKNSIFNSVEVPKEKVEERVDKRKNEESDESSKRQRVEDAEQTRIVMDTPVL
ncbi:hypothetical protein NQ315_015796 [Exocentrus adspersus]|uniref:TRUD domain-containing protein n=1 Tax=Exocentrus adspersus TaxID=1586481 RepID=A0AAV8W3T4_9CUCU|nr:hypothetical protein NQ315_015796 [Exocentrus adspersus]